MFIFIQLLNDGLKYERSGKSLDEDKKQYTF